WPKQGADWLAISAGFAFSLSNVLVRKVQNISIWTKATISFGGVITVCGFLILITGSPVPQVGVPVFLSAAAFGCLGIVAMTGAVLYGVTHMPVHRSAVILLFEIVAGAVSAQLLTNEVVETREWIGGALIISAALFTAHSHTKDTR
ncbi:MAG TPA: DMT family transporter, partial [Nitrospiria bacterium]